MSGAAVKVKNKVGGGAPPMASAPEGPRRTTPNGGHPRNTPENAITSGQKAGSLGFPKRKLRDIAGINPRILAPKDPGTRVSFISMSSLSAETASTTNGEDRKYQDVCKGYTPFHNGDILVAKITPCFENGKIGQAHLSHPIGFGSTEFHVIRPDLTKLDARYLLNYLRQENIRRDGERRMTGSAGQKRVPENFLADLDVPLPPLSEQRRIAEVLDRVERLRAKRRASILLAHTLTQELFEETFGDPIENPRGYPVKPLADLVDPLRPISYGILMPGDDQPDGVKYIRVTDMKRGEIDLSGLRKTSVQISNSYRRSLLKAGDLLMSIRGHVGRFAVIPQELNGANITQDSARLAIKGASPLFVIECLRTVGFQRWMSKHTKGVAVRGINLGDVKQMPIALPPIQAQEKFSQHVIGIHKQLARLRTSLTELDALFTSLQHRAFRGQL